MGQSGVSWQEIQAWVACTKRDLETWELVLVKELSSLFARSITEYHGKASPAPSPPSSKL